MADPVDPKRLDRWTWGDDDYGLSRCVTCVFYLPGVPARCGAFPDGVPIDILTNEHDHTKPYPGDNGIRYTPKPTTKE